MRGGRAEEPADIVIANVEQRLEQAKLMTAIIRRPERDDRFQWRASGHATRDFRDEHRGCLVELEATTRPALDGGYGVDGGGRWSSDQHPRLSTTIAGDDDRNSIASLP